MPAYVFRDEWHVAAPPATVWGAVRHVELWPAWWPSVQRVTRVGSSDAEVWRFVFRTRLPYRMEFDARVLRDDPLHGVRTTVTGRVEGSGRWEVTGVDGGAVVRFDWEVRPRLAWMRLLSPLARPLFVWNHAALMREGGKALADRLGTQLAGPPVSSPAVAPAVAAAAAWPVGLLGLYVLFRRSRTGGGADGLGLVVCPEESDVQVRVGAAAEATRRRHWTPTGRRRTDQRRGQQRGVRRWSRRCVSSATATSCSPSSPAAGWAGSGAPATRCSSGRWP